MERFYKRKEPQFLEKNDDASKQKDKSGSKRDDDCGKKQKNDDAGTMRENDVEVNLLNLPIDSGLRHPITYYNVKSSSKTIFAKWPLSTKNSQFSS